MKIEKNEWIKALTPFKNGCYFKAIFKNNGDVFIDVGCDLRPSLLSGADRYLFELFSHSYPNPFKVDMSEKTKVEILKIKSCSHCGGTLIEDKR